MPQNSRISVPSVRLERQGHERPPVQTSGQRSRNLKRNLNSQNWDVMSISDLEASRSEEPTSNTARNPTPRSPHTRRHLGVIEITTDEESDSVELSPAVNTRIDQVAKESAQTLQQITSGMESLRNEIRELKASLVDLKRQEFVGVDKLLLPAGPLITSITCGICTNCMWVPSTINECGHTFCQCCLVKWFTEAKNQHDVAYPHQQQQHAGQEYLRFFQDISRHPELSGDCLSTFRELLLRYLPQSPRYSCPTCRAQVFSPPTEVFAFKDLIHTVATTSASSAGGNPHAAARQSQSRASSAPWNLFFATRPTSIP